MEHLLLSAGERSSGRLNPETLDRACNQVRLNGYVVLANAMPTDFIDRLCEDWLAVLRKAMETSPDKTDVGKSDFRKRRVRMDTPFRAPYTDSQLVANPFVMPIIEKILGDDCRVFYYSADAPLSGSEYQNVHADYLPFYPDSDVVLPPTSLVVNYPLVDVTENNGPMDAWPNTHMMPEKVYADTVKLQAAASAIDPTSMLTPKGSILIRDVRMWHRGTPNNSNEIRPNLALIYGRQWFDGAFYPQDSLGITRASYEALSERAKQLFRLEPIAE